MQTIHATCVAFQTYGILLRGPAGSGKSDLALRLIERGAVLVADDLVTVTADNGQAIARLPQQTQAYEAMLEVRGIGLVKVPHQAETGIDLVVDLSPQIDRLPYPLTTIIEGVELKAILLNPFEASATAKIHAALAWERAA